MGKIIVLLCIILVIIGLIMQRIDKLDKALLEKCDIWNIAIAREQADGSIEPQYIRICQEDYENFARLISK